MRPVLTTGLKKREFSELTDYVYYERSQSLTYAYKHKRISEKIVLYLFYSWPGSRGT